MNIKINSFGQVVNVQDWLLVQNANYLNTNKIILEFDESFTQEQLNNFYTARLTVDLPDGRTLNNLYMGKVVEDGITSFIHEVDENSQIFAVKGSIGLSIVVISATNGVLATVKTRAFVQENNGISSQEEYDSAVKEIDDNYIKPFEKRTQQNFQALDTKIEAKIKDFWQLDNISAYIGDLNALTIPCTKTISPANVSNYPNKEVGAGIIYVIKHSEQVIFQLFLENSSTANINLLTRANIAGNWTEWNAFTSISKHLALEATVNNLADYVHGLVLNSDLFIILAPGEELPEQGVANKFYLKPIPDGESPNVFDEYIFVKNKWEYLGKAGITANLTDYVKFTDYPQAGTRAGVVKTIMNRGIFNDNGVLYTVMAEDAWIHARTSRHYPIVPANLDFAIKDGIVNNKITLTDEEKAAAHAWLGAVAKPEGIGNRQVVVYNEDGTTSAISVADVGYHNPASIARNDNKGEVHSNPPTTPSSCATKEYADKKIVLADLVAILTNQDHETFISLSKKMAAGECIILASYYQADYYQADTAPIYAVPTIEGSDGTYRWRLTLALSLTTVFIVEVSGDGETLVYNYEAYDHTNFIAKNSTEEWTFTLEDGSTITKKVAVVDAEA